MNWMQAKELNLAGKMAYETTRCRHACLINLSQVYLPVNDKLRYYLFMKTCSLCGGPIFRDVGDKRWWHVFNGRVGGATVAEFLEILRLGCFNHAVPGKKK